MKILKNGLLFIVLIVWFFPNFGQSQKMNDKCFDTCESVSKYEVKYNTLPRYKGQDKDTFSNTNIYSIRFTPQDASVKRIKQVMTEGCLSQNINDCLVWCLVKVPKLDSIEYFVKDTFLFKEFELIDVPIVSLIKEGGVLEPTEVICSHKIKSKLIKKIQKQLFKKGFYKGDINGSLDQMTMSALVNFQKSNDISNCGVSIETLKVLQIKS